MESALITTPPIWRASSSATADLPLAVGPAMSMVSIRKTSWPVLLRPRANAQMGDEDNMARYEAKAEEAYAAMYDAAPHNVKDHYEDACLYLNRAIEIAKTQGLDAEVGRLAARVEHVTAVYNSQFRYVGR
jgi:hypothetical protein